jgi:glycosyltransferase involved in cell wall biosynthesis
MRRMSRRWQALSSIPAQRSLDGIEVSSPRFLNLPRAAILGFSGWTYWLGARKKVFKLARRSDFDLIHAHTTLPDGFAATLFARRLGIPTFVTVHGADAYWGVHQGTLARRAILTTWERADRVICVSERVRRWCLAHWTGPEGKFVVVPNGMAFDQLASEDQADEIRGRYPGRMLLLTTATLVPRKAHEYVLRALPGVVSGHPDLLYLVVGAGGELQHLRELTCQMGLENHVEFCGAQPHSEAMAYMAACDAFIMPSWDEAFGIVYLEAMAHGKPIVGSQGEGIAGIVTHGETGLLVPPRSVDAIEEALLWLLDHPVEAERMGQRARSLVERQYTWEHNACRVKEIYEEILAQ